MSINLLDMWVALVRKMWGFLATSHAPITANENLANKPYFWALSANLEDLLRTVVTGSIILDIFDTFHKLSYS